jgi:predicted PurR-regulated permease PerM
MEVKPDVNISEWIKVVTHPFGLAAFSLFLVFLLVSRTTKAAKNRWLQVSFILMAFVTLLGGIGLAYRQISLPTSLPEKISAPLKVSPDSTTVPEIKQMQPSIQQSTKGSNSPAIADVKGDVTIITEGQTKAESSK